MPKLRNWLASSNNYEGEIGLEIETESKATYGVLPSIGNYWGVHQDGSLRQNGLEYVFLQPYTPGGQAYKAAMEAFAEQAKVTKFLKSSYTSVHVHLNMLDRQLTSIMNFITLYYLFEEVLTEYCGAARNGNLFCLKTSNAEAHYKAVCELAKAIENGSGIAAIKRLNNDHLKYAGLNIVPLRTFGSLEVRTHPGTVDVDLINRWVEILRMIYKKADTFANPVEIINRLDGYRSKEAFAELIFEEYSKFLNLKDMNDKMKNGVWYACAVAKSVDNWKSFGDKKTIEKSKRTFDLTTYYAEAPELQPVTNVGIGGAAVGTTTWTTATRNDWEIIERVATERRARTVRPVTQIIEDF